MKDVVGSPGTKTGLLLRLGQFGFAAASVAVMVSASGFSNYTAFCYLIASMGLQVLWSFGLACLDVYALRIKRDLQSPVLVSLFVVGDWVDLRLIFLLPGSRRRKWTIMSPSNKSNTSCNVSLSPTCDSYFVACGCMLISRNCGSVLQGPWLLQITGSSLWQIPVICNLCLHHLVSYCYFFLSHVLDFGFRLKS